MCTCDIATMPAFTATAAHKKQLRDRADGRGVQGQQNCVPSDKKPVPVFQ